MADCIGPTNIIPNNNQVVLVDVNKTITVIDNNCCTTVDVTQPVTSVVQVLTGPIGAKGDTGASGSQGPAGPSGSQGPAGPSGSSQPFSYVSGNIWATTSSLEISGSLTVSGSSTFTNIGLALFSGSTNLSGSGTLNGYNLLTSNDTGSLLLSSSFNQFTSSYYTDSASFDTRILNNSSSIAVLSSSYIASSASFSASIASLTDATSSYVLNSQTSSMTVLSASFASTASYVQNAQTASYVQNTISASYAQTASYALNAVSSSFASTASYVQNAQTASYVTTAQTASYVLQAVSASYANTASYVTLAQTASYVTTAQTASYVNLAQTASYVLNAVSSSYAATASLAPNYLPLTGGTINGNVTVNGTASIAFLNVTYESASVIYSSGSNQFGDASNDVQTLWGTVDIKTGPVLVTGSVITTSGFTGSLLGTASSAVTSSYSNFANTASGILGGKATHVPYFITDTTFATSSIYQSGSSTVIINQDNATTAAPEALYVYQPSTTSYNVISGKGNLNNYLQLNIQNTNQGTDASSDVVATANNGNETIHYIDMGINSENYSGFLGGANDAYLYSAGHNLWIGNSSDGYKVYFFNSSSLQPIITLNSDNAEVTGSLFGTASWAQNATTASNSITASYALNADLLDGKDSTVFATTGSNIFIGNQIVTGSLFTTGSNTLIGSTTLTGSLNITGSTTQIGNNTLSGNTTLSGSIIISGSSAPGSPTASVQIYGDIRQTGYHRFDPVTTNIDNSISASYIYVSGSTQDLYFTQNGSGFSNTTRLRWLEGNIYTGILTGGVISGSVGGTTFNVSSGSGIIVTLNATTASRDPYPTIKYVEWPQFTNITPTYLNTYDTTWLLIDSNGNLVQQSVAPTNGQYDTDIQIGSIIHPNLSTISLFKTFTVTSYGIAQQTYEFIRSFGGLKISGHQISASGSSLSLNRSAGVAYSLGRNYINNANKPSLVTDSGYDAPNVFRYYKSGSVFVTATGTNTLDPTNYNTPTTSTGLSAVPGGLYSIQRVFYFPNQINTIGVYYGRETYNSISTALANLPYETFEENNNTLTQAIFLGYVVVKSGTSDLSNTSDAKIILAGTFRNTTGGGGGAAVVTSLNDLSDVSITGASIGDLLVYNGAEWQNTKTVPSITGSLLGTASFAITSISASHATTSSYSETALSSSYALTASFALNGGGGGPAFPYTGSAIITGSLVVTGSTTSTQGFTGSLFGTASWAENSISASHATTASYALTAQTLLGSVTSASYAATSSHATNFVVEGTLALNGTLTDSAIVLSTIVGSNNLFTQATGSRTSAFGKYTLYKGTNARAGEFMTVWNGTTTTYTDTSTTDIGDTSDITFSSAIVSGDIQINAVAASSGWTIKMLTTYI